MNRPRALVFDLDDTLYLQADFKRSGFRAVAQWLHVQRGFDIENVMDLLEAILDRFGPSYPHMFDELTASLTLDPKLVARLTQVFIDHEPEIHCFPGILELLLRLRRDYALGLLTDGRASVQWKKIQALGLNGVFDKILCSDSWGMEKPAAALFQYFEVQFGQPSTAMVYIGDNPAKDFVGARRRGWLTARVLTGEHAWVLPASSEYAPSVVLAAATEIEDWLNQPNQQG